MVEKRALLALLLATTMTGSAFAASGTHRTEQQSPGKNFNVAAHAARFHAASTPLLEMRERLIMALWTLRGPGILQIPILGNDYQVNGIQDGPDGVDPLGAKDRGIHPDGPFPVNSSTRTY